MPFPVQYIGANPFDLQAQEEQSRLAAIQAQLAGQRSINDQELIARQNMAREAMRFQGQESEAERGFRERAMNLEQSFKERSPEWQLGQEKVNYLTGATPDERSEVMRSMFGMPHPSEIAYREAATKHIGAEEDIARQQVALTGEQVAQNKLKIANDMKQFEQTYKLEQDKLKLMGRDVDLREADYVSKRFNDSMAITQKMIANLTDKKLVQAELNKFTNMWAAEVANPRLPAHTAIGLGMNVIENIIANAATAVKAGNLSNEQAAQIGEQLQVINHIIWRRIQSIKDTDPESYRSQMMLWQSGASALQTRIDEVQRGLGMRLWDKLTNNLMNVIYGSLGAYALYKYGKKAIKWGMGKWGKPPTGGAGGPIEMPPVPPGPTTPSTGPVRVRTSKVKGPKGFGASVGKGIKVAGKFGAKVGKGIKGFGAVSFIPVITGGGLRRSAITPEMEEWEREQLMQ